MWWRISVFLLLAFAAAAAQEVSPGVAARQRFDLIATRAEADFRSVESIEAGLQSRGLALHPQWTALCLRIESSLKGARQALDNQDLARANKAMDRAQALLDRLAKRLGEN